MKLSTRHDIEAPLDHVYAAMTDVDRWETAAMRRGADVARTDKLGRFDVGAAWTVDFVFRGKARKLSMRVQSVDAPSRITLVGNGPTLDGSVAIDLLALSPRRTRVIVGTELKPRTLGARLMLQSLKLAKARVERRYDQRITTILTDIEERYQAAKRR